MSDTGNNSGSGGDNPGPSFTERELQLLGFAMQCLKSGPPEIDYEKLAVKAGMTNPRSAGNAWARIRQKLMNDAPMPAKNARTPSKKATLKKSGDSEGDGEATTPTPKPKAKATPRKRKQEADGEDGTPKKKGRVTKSKKTVDEDDEDTVKTEVKMEDDGDESPATEANGEADVANGGDGLTTDDA